MGLPSVPYHSIKVMTTSKDYIGDTEVLITSYDLMSRCAKELQQVNFGVFIMVSVFASIKSFRIKSMEVISPATLPLFH